MFYLYSTLDKIALLWYNIVMGDSHKQFYQGEYFMDLENVRERFYSKFIVDEIKN